MTSDLLEKLIYCIWPFYLNVFCCKYTFRCICFLSLYLVGIYGVGKAAEHPPALAVLSHTPVGATQTIAWVGKGIVYDTGGLSIKGKVILFFLWRSDKNLRHCETPMCSAFILVSVICLHIAAVAYTSLCSALCK